MLFLFCFNSFWFAPSAVIFFAFYSFKSAYANVIFFTAFKIFNFLFKRFCVFNGYGFRLFEFLFILSFLLVFKIGD